MTAKKSDLRGEIFESIKDSDNPVSTSDLAAKLGKSWHTIDRACLMLQIEGKIEGFKIGRMDLWRIK